MTARDAEPSGRLELIGLGIKDDHVEWTGDRVDDRGRQRDSDGYGEIGEPPDLAADTPFEAD
jgi:hypothetical protein